MIIVPLIMASMISAVTSLGDVRKLGGLGVKSLIYFSVTTAISVVIGLVLVNLIRPGVGAELVISPISALEKVSERSPWVEVLLMLVPQNLFQAMSETQILPLIVFSLFFGSVLTTLGAEAKSTIQFFAVVNKAMMKIVQIIILMTPVGVFSLIAGRLGASGGAAFGEELARLGKYAATVVIGLGVHGIIVLPLIFFLLTRRNPLTYFLGMAEALFTAFSTASSAATLPITLRCVEKKNDVAPESAGFVCPLGATVNMDGTALYEAVAAMFIAQSYGIHLDLGQQIVIFVTATLAAIGAAGIPEAGLVTMVMVLGAVGLPLEGIGGILAIDWLLDRFRTTINVWGDSIGAAIMERTKEVRLLHKPQNP